LAVHEHQPVKLAAIEGIWETERGAPLLLFAWPDEEQEANRYAVGVPNMGSLIVTHDPNGEIAGLKAVAPSERPPVAPVFFSFRVMVGIGVLMLLLVIASAVQWRRGRLTESRGLLRAWKWMTPAGFIAVLAGWYTTEIGRQPYVIQGEMRTEEALSAVGAGSVLTSLLVFVTVYFFVFIAGAYYLLQILRRGPQPADQAMLHPEDKRAARPLSASEEPLEA